VTIPNLVPGSHIVELSGVAANCSVDGENPQAVTVILEKETLLAFSVSCSASQIARWSVVESGRGATDIWTTQAAEPLGGYAANGAPGEILSLTSNGWSSETLAQPWKLFGVWGRSATEAFAVGHVDLERSPEAEYAFRGVVLQRQAGVWLEMPGLKAPSGTEGVPWRLADAWGSGTDLFAVGGFIHRLDGVPTGALVAHYDGQDWSVIELLESEYSYLNDVSGSSRSDVYAVGYTAGPLHDFDPGHVLHYDGTTWSEVLRVGNSITKGASLQGVWAASSTAVFVVGYEYDGGPSIGIVLRYDGTTWSEIYRERGVTLEAVWGTSPSDVYALGWGGTILHYDGANWTRQSVPAEGTQGILLGIWGRSPSDIYVGERGTIFHGTP
jgi:hypothetical protein